MKESVKNFIEKNILALEEEDIVLFLYLAFVQLNREDVNVLCDYFDTAGIEYKKHVPAVLEELVNKTQPKRILEIGTAIGYSGTIILLSAMVLWFLQRLYPQPLPHGLSSLAPWLQ